ncbi:tetrathionate reductase subunit A [Vibrio sp. SCSIO 43137]|uniref:tetrathionate reductase subunit A n=1 Tax=Vibrio sp. SCSIO 43137 TaxID=3021011 RepID=UPI0023076169|nr:tetrathionate reductase subunit A [Vibrio sp. SCSIO 43137]WCE30070.1 tetrathionate reductase subunit A [Vibrio sp. SCSIO 43137]
MAALIMDRRQFLKTGVATAITGGIAGSPETKAAENQQKISHYAPLSAQPEFVLGADNKLTNNPDQRFAFTKCFGCYNVCGARIRVDNNTDQILRVCGNPYALSTQSGDPIAMEVSPQEAMLRLSGDQGNQNRSTLCGRGNAVPDAVTDSRRVTQCLKRVGKRGENQWKTIPYEQLIKEVVEGGDLFGEGHVDGLKQLHDDHNLANPAYPDFGQKKNQLLMTGCSEDPARWDFYKRFSEASWGTPNLGNKDSYCGHQQVAGCALGVEDGANSGALPTTDFEHCEFAIFIGTNPGLSGISLNSASKRLADARTENPDFKYVVIDPILRSLSSSSTPDRAEWVPIRSGGDTALMHAMMQYIINNKRYNKTYLSSCSQEGANKAGEINYTNAPYLVVTDSSHPLYRKFLTAEACGVGSAETKMVIDAQSKQLVSAESSEPCDIDYQGRITTKDGQSIQVASAFSLLKQRVNQHSMAEYSEECQIPVEKINQLAHEFSSHGRKVSIETNTGCNASDGGQFAFAMIMLATLVAAHNAKGGMLHTGSMGYENSSPLYDMMAFEHSHLSGFNAERSGDYRQSNEYKEKLAKGVEPFPSDQPWNETFIQDNAGELLVAHANGNPFHFKAWIAWANNPLYACSGLADQVVESIKDPKKLGLMIATDPYFSETNIYADYFVPDLAQYEQWGASRQWGSELMGDVVSFPVITPRTPLNKEGNRICMEQLLIDIAKGVQLNGFGDHAFKDAAGQPKAIHTPEDYYIPVLANLAHSDGALPVPTEEDIRFTSVDRITPLLKQKLKPEEVGPTQFLFTRGGRYYPVESRYEGEFFNEMMRWDAEFQIYNEGLAHITNFHTGEYLDGLPVFDKQRFWDGTAIRDLWKEEEYPFYFSTFKHQLRSPYSVTLDRITALGQSNFIQINQKEARKYQLKTGDTARVISPKGTFIEGTVQADDTVAMGCIVVPLGFGHTAFGASDITIDGKTQKGIARRGGGMAVNAFNAVDPTRKGASLYRDVTFGSTARHGTPVRIEKV